MCNNLSDARTDQHILERSNNIFYCAPYAIIIALDVNAQIMAVYCCRRTVLRARLYLGNYACDRCDFYTILCRSSRRRNRVVSYNSPMPALFTRSQKLQRTERRKLNYVMHRRCGPHPLLLLLAAEIT